jgi:hypothetical protein
VLCLLTGLAIVSSEEWHHTDPFGDVVGDKRQFRADSDPIVTRGYQARTAAAYLCRSFVWRSPRKLYAEDD